jgi:NAD(P)-dependent dehydrogenase (short-subunit alcohol dehydrogenase family)
MEKMLKGKTAIVTGATKGIGLAIAELFAEEGANMVLTARGGPLLHDAVDRIVAAGGKDEIGLQHSRQDAALRLALIQHKRGTLLRLRDERRIDDTVLRQVQRALDIEEERLSRPHEDP